MPNTRREHVSRVRRDGLTASQHWSSVLSACFRDGAHAEQAGVPRYANPYTETKKTNWTIAWNVSHTRGKPEGCAGCKLCLNGTTPPTARDLETYNRLVGV